MHLTLQAQNPEQAIRASCVKYKDYVNCFLSEAALVRP
jgi:hypothetical protein